MIKKFNEFDIISRYFAPLARDYPGALGLTDDAALIKPIVGHDIVVTTDILVAGVHFPELATPETTASRVIGCNLSDLAAMGATPLAFVLASAWPNTISEDWINSFSLSVGNISSANQITLIGGDTVATKGPMSHTVTAFGTVPSGFALTRRGTKPGDQLFVSGTIGDSALGLLAIKGKLTHAADQDIKTLVDRFRNPLPRLILGKALRGVASSVIDISDGLVQDLSHIARASHVSFEVEYSKIPVSMAARNISSISPDLKNYIFSGGDDYELAFTVSQDYMVEFKRIRESLDVPVTEIGYATEGDGDVNLRDTDGSKIRLEVAGYRHVFGDK
ncbi:MAG: Thiamine-monophosphate kinase [Alphaproteobacteria bacterium MarineAlpha3_Bin5]|nr:thiamine-phosphate kinase [Magnetovibrio sp.]PPR78614.1 MAG: Thiamine-monophosphate kinase [Alphaproteobacteria bacterium MarineAlpha3_Bin5]